MKLHQILALYYYYKDIIIFKKAENSLHRKEGRVRCTYQLQAVLALVGSHTVARLLQESYEVRILDNLQKPVHLKGKPDYISEKAEFIPGDTRDKETPEKAMRDIDAIYHLAAYQDYLPDFSTYFHVNSVSTALIYEIIVEKKFPIRKVIVASSQAVLVASSERTQTLLGLNPKYPEIRQIVEAAWKWHSNNPNGYEQ